MPSCISIFAVICIIIIMLSMAESTIKWRRFSSLKRVIKLSEMRGIPLYFNVTIHFDLLSVENPHFHYLAYRHCQFFHYINHHNNQIYSVMLRKHNHNHFFLHFASACKNLTWLLCTICRLTWEYLSSGVESSYITMIYKKALL
jgi:hypothetical protein